MTYTEGDTPEHWIGWGALLICSDLGGLYAIALGLSAVLSGRSLRRIGAAVLGVGMIWTVALSYAKYNAGSALVGSRMPSRLRIFWTG